MLRSYGRLLTSSSIRHARRASTAIVVEPYIAAKKPRRPRLPKIDTKPGANVTLAERQASLESSLQWSVKTPVRRRRKEDGPTAAATGSDLKAVEELGDATETLDPKKRVKKDTAATSESPLETDEQKPVRRRKAVAKAFDTEEDNALPTLASSGMPKPKRRTKKALAIPPRLLPPVDQKHHDLSSFLTHASRSNLNTASTVYRGTHFEYTVAGALRAFDFNLQRTGRSNDLGIDLVGHWSLPTERKRKTYEVPVIVQCKAARPTPSMIRELEGAYTGAPSGWRGDGVLALLANVHPSTKGVRGSRAASRWPLGVLQVTREGEVKQFLWNAVAAQAGLEGLGVALRYASKRGGMLQAVGDDEEGESTASSIGLTWMGKPWLPSAAQLAKQDAAATRALLKS